MSSTFPVWLQNVESEGRLRAQIKHWEEIYTKIYKINPELLSDDYVKVLSDYVDLEDHYYKMNVWYIVVNPKPGIEMYEFIKACRKACTKKWIHTFDLWFEFRNEKPESIHANFCLRKSLYPMSRVKREFYNTLKNFIGEDEDYRDNYINVQQCEDSEAEKILAYMDDPKKKKRDTMMREKFAIDKFYHGAKPDSAPPLGKPKPALQGKAL